MKEDRNGIADSEVPKYRKKKKSSTSKSREKSKHKHVYADCLLIDKNGKPRKATYCTICGRIGELHYFEAIKVNEDGSCYYQMLSDEEVFEKYEGIKKIYVDDLYGKYAPVVTEVT